VALTPTAVHIVAVGQEIESTTFNPGAAVTDPTDEPSQ
jgi:hypothetical protein